ncbi:hypothetical protein CW362_30590 [Streptomyces populi]|uniref:Uncharacterized protein n=1 Tax=Streptomyces populi TaxID=2058924 RepID=A0A2I0SH66_9ACTN|nr:hypothetical protein [Streptomyces populi]PKT69270.1 hypothetical protein CW362_30590 [Streptomyces populi]
MGSSLTGWHTAFTASSVCPQDGFGLVDVRPSVRERADRCLGAVTRENTAGAVRPEHCLHGTEGPHFTPGEKPVVFGMDG